MRRTKIRAFTFGNQGISFSSRYYSFNTGNIETPGFEKENLLKPQITAKIEGASTPVSAESCAKSLLAGFYHDLYYFSNDLLGELARISVNGGTPRDLTFFEVVSSPLLALIFTLWSRMSDYEIRSFYKTKTE